MGKLEQTGVFYTCQDRCSHEHTAMWLLAQNQTNQCSSIGWEGVQDLTPLSGLFFLPFVQQWFLSLCVCVPVCVINIPLHQLLVLCIVSLSVNDHLLHEETSLMSLRSELNYRQGDMNIEHEKL